MSSRHSVHLDPRSPFVLDTHELGRRAGAMLELARNLPAPDGWALELVRVPVGTPVALTLRLESVMDGVLVSGSLRTAIAAECGRCLEPVTEQIEVSIAELFGYEPDPDDDDLPVLHGDLIDLEPVLRDAFVLGLPLNPVCEDTCEGLCATCGERLADLGPDHGHDRLDPRWAALSALQAQPPSQSATMNDNEPLDSPRLDTPRSREQ